MKFDDWMKEEGLSDSSVKKYYGAIEGVMSEWVLNARILNGSILEITSKIRFDAVVIKLKLLPVFQERNSTGHNMYSCALNKYSEYLNEGAISSVDEDIEEIVLDTSITETEKITLVSTRVGQGEFRKSLISYWGSCAVTGYVNSVMLVASHIKPWSRSSNIERLDKYNGLLLTPALDRAFDQGLISFSKTGNILVSPSFKDASVLGINESMSVEIEEKHDAYMSYHREQVYIDT